MFSQFFSQTCSAASGIFKPYLPPPSRFKKRDFNQLSFQQKDKFLTKYFFTKSKTCDKTKKQKQGNSDKALPKTVGRDGSHHLDGL